MTIYFIGNENKEHLESVAYTTMTEALKALDRIKVTNANARIYTLNIQTT
jgi:hypothetical protein